MNDRCEGGSWVWGHGGTGSDYSFSLCPKRRPVQGIGPRQDAAEFVRRCQARVRLFPDFTAADTLVMASVALRPFSPSTFQPVSTSARSYCVMRMKYVPEPRTSHWRL